MKKITLDLSTLEVESFGTGPEPATRGTVQARTGMSNCNICDPADSFPNCPEASYGGTCGEATCGGYSFAGYYSCNNYTCYFSCADAHFPGVTCPGLPNCM